MSTESEVEKTARFTRHVIQAIIVIAIIIIAVIGSIILIGLYEVHQTVNSLNQAMPLTTIKVSTQDVTVNVPFTVTITTNQIKNYNNIQYVITGDGFNTGIDPNSGIMKTETLTIQVTIDENEYQFLAEKQGYYNAIPNSLNNELGVLLSNNALIIGSADTNIVISSNQAVQTPQSTPTPLITPTLNPLSSPTPTPSETVQTEKVSIQGVNLNAASSTVTVYAQSTNNMAVTINSIVIKNSNGDTVCSLTPTGTSGALNSNGALAAITVTGITGVTTGTPYSVTLVSSKGGSFVSSAVIAG